MVLELHTKFAQIKPNIFCLSPGIKNVYEKEMGIPSDQLFVTPNGVNTNNFEFESEAKYPDRSIYLAKIDYRKTSDINFNQ